MSTPNREAIECPRITPGRFYLIEFTEEQLLRYDREGVCPYCNETHDRADEGETA